ASGFVVTDSGIMFTDRHAVINPGDRIDVTINGTKHQAQVIANEQGKDTSLLQITPNFQGEKFQAVRLESSNMRNNTELIGMGFAKTSNDFSISPGKYLGDTSLSRLAPIMKNGMPQGQDPNQEFKVFEANIQAGNSGELVVNKETGGI